MEGESVHEGILPLIIRSHNMGKNWVKVLLLFIVPQYMQHPYNVDFTWFQTVMLHFITDRLSA